MGKSKKSAPKVNNTIATNKKARFEYFIEDRLEAGICLQGWEVKSLRDRRVQLGESYVLLKSGEAWLFGAHISPLPTASTHINPDPTRWIQRCGNAWAGGWPIRSRMRRLRC